MPLFLLGILVVPLLQAGVSAVNAPEAPTLLSRSPGQLHMKVGSINRDLRPKSYKLFWLPSDGGGIIKVSVCAAPRSTCTAIDLKSARQYNLRALFCYDQGGIEKCSPLSAPTTAWTMPIAPDPPQLVSRFEELLVMSVNPLRAEGIAFYYKIRWRPLEDTSAANFSLNCEGVVCKITGLEPARLYRLNALACYIKTEEICSKLSESVIEGTAPNRPDQPILVKKLFDQLHLKLKPVQSKWQTFTYKLIWLPLNPALFNGSIVDCVGLKCVVIGLDPLSSYIISAVTCYQIGQPICSEHSEILIASTLPVTPDPPTLVKRFTDMLHVSATPLRPDGNTYAYRMQWRSASYNASAHRKVNCSDLACNVTGLKPSHVYLIQAIVCTRGECSDPSTSITVGTLPIAPPAPRLAARSLGMLHMGVGAPPQHHLRLLWRPVDGTVASEEVDCSPMHTTCTATDLRPARQYSLRSTSCYSDGSAELCSEASSATTAWTLPNTPAPPLLENRFADQLVMRVTQLQPDAHTYTYNLLWSSTEAPDDIPSTVVCAGLSCSIDGLSASHTYSITALVCYSTTEEICGTPSAPITEGTRPNPPMAPAVSSVSADELEVKIVPLPDGLQQYSYKLLWRPSDGSEAVKEVVCSSAPTTCSAIGLKPDRQYSLRAIACYMHRSAKICSDESATTTATTLEVTTSTTKAPSPPPSPSPTPQMTSTALPTPQTASSSSPSQTISVAPPSPSPTPQTTSTALPTPQTASSSSPSQTISVTPPPPSPTPQTTSTALPTPKTASSVQTISVTPVTTTTTQTATTTTVGSSGGIANLGFIIAVSVEGFIILFILTMLYVFHDRIRCH